MIRNRCFDMGAAPMDKMSTNKMGMDTVNTECMDMGINNCNMVPVYECPQERCCHREIHHEVKHIVPVNTKIMNHHIILLIHSSSVLIKMWSVFGSIFAFNTFKKNQKSH